MNRPGIYPQSKIRQGGCVYLSSIFTYILRFIRNSFFGIQNFFNAVLFYLPLFGPIFFHSFFYISQLIIFLFSFCCICILLYFRTDGVHVNFIGSQWDSRFCCYFYFLDFSKRHILGKASVFVFGQPADTQNTQKYTAGISGRSAKIVSIYTAYRILEAENTMDETF